MLELFRLLHWPETRSNRFNSEYEDEEEQGFRVEGLSISFAALLSINRGTDYPEGPSTQQSYTSPEPVLQVLIQEPKVPNYEVQGC